MIEIAIFASGNGTNMEAIANYIEQHPEVGCRVACVLVDKADAYVMTRARTKDIPAYFLTRAEWRDADRVLGLLSEHRVDGIILAGFLSLVPTYLLEAYPSRILNIHPALLPKYGGKGMYGMHVHETVKAAGEHETGITIHEIDHEYDRGKIVFQAKVDVLPTDSAEDIAQKVHQLEYRYFPEVAVTWLRSKLG